MPGSVRRILVSGFEPFDDMHRNPSGEIALALDGAVVSGALVRGVVLPVVYVTAPRVLSAAIADWGPDVVVSLGLADGQEAITPERVAINLDLASIADNAGDLRTDQPIDPGGEPAWFSRLPTPAIVTALLDAGIRARESLTAGAFVCNHLFYETMALLADTRVRAGFIHVPALPEMTDTDEPSMPLDEQVRGIRVALEAIVAAG